MHDKVKTFTQDTINCCDYLANSSHTTCFTWQHFIHTTIAWLYFFVLDNVCKLTIADVRCLSKLTSSFEVTIISFLSASDAIKVTLNLPYVSDPALGQNLTQVL